MNIRGDDYHSLLIRGFRQLVETFCHNEEFDTDRLEQLANFLDSKNKRNWPIRIPPLDISLESSNDQQQRKIFQDNSAFLRFFGEIVVKDGKLIHHVIQSCLIYKNTVQTSCNNKQHRRESCCITNGINYYHRVVRKFHFDIHDSGHHRDKHMHSHLQYGGLYPDEINDGKTHYCLDSNLELPRIPYPPLSFLSIVDMFLREFKIGYNLYVNDYWRKLVRESEEKFIAPFLNTLYSNLGNKRIYTTCEEMQIIPG